MVSKSPWLSSLLSFLLCFLQTWEKPCLGPQLFHGSMVCVQPALSSELPGNTKHLYWLPMAGAEDAQHALSKHLTGLDP